MGSVSFFRKFMQNFGVELGLLGALAIAFYLFNVPGFAVTKNQNGVSSLSNQARTTVEKIKEIVVQASESEKAFIKARREQDLSAYNQYVGQLNHHMRQLIQYSGNNPDVYKQVSELNKNLRLHFEAVNEILTSRQNGKSVSGRVPASTGIIQSLDVLLESTQPHVPAFLRWDVIVSALGGCIFLIFLSRLWQGQELRRQTQRSQRLQSRSILLDTILNSMSEALIVVDAKGRFTHYNAAAQRIIGTRIKEVASEASAEELGFYDATSGEIYSRKQLPFHRSLRGEQIDELEIYVQNETHAEGVYISVSSRPLNGIDGGIDGALVVFRDVSRRKMVEQEWQRAREAALDASLKKSDFLAAMSHEIRTPMNGVLGMTTLLADTALNAEQKEYVGTVKRSAESLLMLINDILDYSKIEAGKVTLDPQPFDLHLLVQDVVEMFKPAISEKNVGIRLLINDTTNWCFSADQGRLRQILVNLMGNAVKFTEKGSVILEVSKADANEGLSTLKFEVKDTGPGLKEEERRALFQKYFQTKMGMKFGGTGLGLSISKQLVDLMGGEIGVESVVGLGSNFWFTVTLPNVAQQQVPRLNEVKFAPVFSGYVLLVEDQVVNQKVAQMYLQKLGLKVDVANNGLVAFEKCMAQNYDLVLMDCQMPVLDGYEATRRIRKEEQKTGKRVPIVALTAESYQDEKIYREIGMDDFLAKPLELNRLMEALHKWIKSSGDSLDLSALDKLQNYVVNDQNLIVALVEEFALSTPELIQTMQTSLQKSDLRGISEAAHALKSASATLGAKKLSELCAALEALEDIKSAQALVAEVEQQFDKSLKDLKDYTPKKQVA